MTRLRNLFVSSNQICKVDPEVSKKLLALETLVLNNNKIEEFTDLDGLLECKTLKYLSLMENPINKKPHYRLRIIGMLPWLRALDFRKITMDEKKAAKNLRLGASEDVEESETMPSKRSSTRSKMDRSAAVEAPKSKRQKLSEQELEKIKKQIAEATSLEEISRLEKILETGYNL